jgi:hypothetical protein
MSFTLFTSVLLVRKFSVALVVTSGVGISVGVLMPIAEGMVKLTSFRILKVSRSSISLQETTERMRNRHEEHTRLKKLADFNWRMEIRFRDSRMTFSEISIPSPDLIFGRLHST